MAAAQIDRPLTTFPQCQTAQPWPPHRMLASISLTTRKWTGCWTPLSSPSGSPLETAAELAPPVPEPVTFSDIGELLSD
jgi:hypothetical protein